MSTTEELPTLLAPMTPDERALLREVLQWAIRAGWKRLPDSRKWGHYLSADNRYSVMISSTCLFVGRPGRSCAIIGSDRVGEMIAVLVELHVIPDRFSPTVRANLSEFARVCEQQGTQQLLDEDVATAGTRAQPWFAIAQAARDYVQAA